MSVEKRRNGRLYLYTARRCGGRVRKTYVGVVDGQTAQRIAAEQAERLAQRQAEREMRKAMLAAGATLVELGDACDDIVCSAVAAAGWYQHHREWRHFGGSEAKNG
jgi:hypothetical protein